MSKLPFERFLQQALKRNKVLQAHPEVLARGSEMIKRCYNEGIYVLFTDGLRTDIDQAVLYGKGRASSSHTVYKGIDYAKPKEGKVTNAKPYDSMHNYGLALDYVLTDEQAKNVYWKRNKQWERAATIAKELGFVWGGDWKGFVDNPHIEYNGGLTISQIKRGQFPAFKPFNQTEEDDDTMKFTSTTTRDVVGDHIKQMVTHGYIGQQWVDDFNKGILTNGDYNGLKLIAAQKKANGATK